METRTNNARSNDVNWLFCKKSRRRLVVFVRNKDGTSLK